MAILGSPTSEGQLAFERSGSMHSSNDALHTTLAGDTGNGDSTDSYQPARPGMSAGVRRPLTPVDLAIPVAATAIGVSLVQFGWPRKVAGVWIFTWPGSPSKGGYPSKTWVLPIAERAAPFLPCLAAWTGAFLAARLRAPRPRRR